MIKIEIGQIWFYKNESPSLYGYKINRIDNNYAYCQIITGGEIPFGRLDENGCCSSYNPDYDWHFKWAMDAFCKKECGKHRSECRCK